MSASPELEMSSCAMRRSCRCARRGGQRDIEGGAVGQHPMQHDGKFAGQRDLGLAHPGTAGHAHGPTLQPRSLHRSGENDVRRFVEHGTDTDIADLGVSWRSFSRPGQPVDPGDDQRVAGIEEV